MWFKCEILSRISLINTPEIILGIQMLDEKCSKSDEETKSYLLKSPIVFKFSDYLRIRPRILQKIDNI